MNKQSESVVNIVTALLEAQKEMENVVKGSKNPFFKSNFADINALREEAIPVLNKHGLIILQPPANKNGINYIQTTIYHTSGEYLTSMNEVVTKKEHDPQDYLAAQTYTRRGALQAMLCMGAVDDDGNTANGRTVKDEKPSPVTKKAETKLTIKEAETQAENAQIAATTAIIGGSFRRRARGGQ